MGQGEGYETYREARERINRELPSGEWVYPAAEAAAAASTDKAPTLAEIIETVREFKRRHPPPPEANPDECCNCHEPPGPNAVAVYMGPGILGRLIGYLCPRCTDAVRRLARPGLTSDFEIRGHPLRLVDVKASR